jgi:transposase-like protein
MKPDSMVMENSQAPARKKYQQYSKEFRQQAFALLADGKTRHFVAAQLNVPIATISSWVTQTRKVQGLVAQPLKRYTQLQKETALDIAQNVGLKEAAAAVGAAEITVYNWLIAKGLIYKGYLGNREREIPVSHDKDLLWMKDELPELEAWRVLAAQWVKEQDTNLRGRLLGLRRFFQDYLTDTLKKAGLPTAPADVLSRSVALPNFYTSCLSDYEPGVGRTRNNLVHDFLDWILLTEFSLPDDYGRPVTGIHFHNPVPFRERGGGGQPTESVRSPLPYAYIDELRQFLATGPTFRDWTWAQNVLGGDEGTSGSGGATDWFEVDESLIDKSDPDCVWRRRYTKTGHALQMWSPVRWVALLIKLALPLRAIQVRLLDSGESDTWKYSTSQGENVWTPNTHKLKEGTERKPVKQGVFRRKLQLGSSQASTVVLYINTNKTADSKLSGTEKGFEIPWLTSGPLHGNPFYWLEKLRDWQEKYNPINRKTSWATLGPAVLDPKSEMQLAGFSDTCFLFRTAELGPAEAHLPIGRKVLDVPWFYLLEAYEDKLAKRGDTLPGGGRIELVRERRNYAVFFPLHSLRVSLITALALDGKVPFPILQKIVGHSRLIMTLYYTKFGTEYPNAELQEAAKRIDAARGASVIRFLRDTEHKTLVKNAIANSSASLVAAVAEHPAARNSAGWMPLHHGACLVGGNTSQIEENRSVGGCYNGGPNIGSDSTPRYAPVPGGARNCVRCRWFVTEPHYIWALQAHVNTLFYHSDEAMNAAVKAERQLGELRALRADAEAEGGQFESHELLAQTDRIYETHMSQRLCV